MQLKQWIKYLLALLAHYSGYNGWRLRHSAAHYALMFHRIQSCDDRLSMSLPDHFVRQLVGWTKRYGSAIAINQPDFDRTCFSFSFDDGYADNTQIPELFGDAPVTVFLATGFIGTDHAFWAVELQDLLLHSSRESLDLSSQHLGVHPLQNEHQRIDTLYNLNIAIKSLRPEQIEEVMESVRAQLADITHPTPTQFLSWNTVREMRQRGVQFGSHTHTHIITSRISEAEMLDEIEATHVLFQQQLGFIPTLFAYPNGRAEDIAPHGERVLRLLGYRSAASTIEKPNYPGGNPLCIYRYNMAKNRLMTPWGSPSRAMFTTLLINPFHIH